MRLYLTTSEEEEKDNDVYDCDDDFLFFNISVKFMYQYNKLLSKINSQKS